MSYPIFGRVQPSLEVERPKQRSPELNSKWAKFAKSYLRKNPFCAECGRRGRDVPAQLVDHIIPRAEGGSLWDASNLMAMCHYCHNGVKRELERLALERGNPQILQTWCRHPATRPGKLAFNAIEP